MAEPKDAPVPRSRHIEDLKKLCGVVMEAIQMSLKPLRARIATLEQQQTGGTHAGIAAMMERLDATMRAPVRPVYDSKGILIGARRDVPSGGETVEPAALEALEARIKALEQRPSMSYQGVWAEGEKSLPGDVCTHDGSMWYCWAATKDRPGTSKAWQLCVKRGRDGR